MQSKQDEHFEKLHQKELREISRNFTEDEKKNVLGSIPSSVIEEELRRREKVSTEIIKELMETLSAVVNSNMSLHEMEEVIVKCRGILRVKGENNE